MIRPIPPPVSASLRDGQMSPSLPQAKTITDRQAPTDDHRRLGGDDLIPLGWLCCNGMMTATLFGRASASAAVAAVLLLAALTSCAAGGADGGGSSRDARSPATAEGSGGTPEQTAPGETAPEPAPETAALDVEAIGDGPIGLVAAEESDIPGSAQPFRADGRLFTGPGGCLALTSAERPSTLVFDAGSDFTLKGQRPEVTSPALGTLRVGEAAGIEGVEVPLDSVSGIPDRCAQGANAVLLVAG